MRALIKSSKKIILNQLDPSERTLIDDFVRKSLKQATSIRSLFDIDNELDGISFELSGIKPNVINFKTPYIQVLSMNGTVEIDLDVDDETTIEVNESENDELTVELKDRIICITANDIPEYLGKTKQYIVTVILTKPGFETSIVPINVQVVYFDSSGGTRNYEKLMNLPRINSKILVGDRELNELGIQEEIEPIKNSQIEDMFIDI